MPRTVEIYVRLLDEGTECSRPTQALDLGNGLFKVLPSFDYDPRDEVWEFPPNSIVRSEVKLSQGKEFLFAVAGWHPYENGATIGSPGSERGLIVLDDQHPANARITLERDGETAPFAITCGLAGWFFHTVFFSTEDEAQNAFKSMKAALEHIIVLVPSATEFDREDARIVEEAIQDFVMRFQ
jgi:hypothetical protein